MPVPLLTTFSVVEASAARLPTTTPRGDPPPFQPFDFDAQALYRSLELQSKRTNGLQPGSKPPMTLNRNSSFKSETSLPCYPEASLPTQSGISSKTWSNSLLGWLEMCAFSTACSCVVYSQNRQRVGQLQGPDEAMGDTSGCASCSASDTLLYALSNFLCMSPLLETRLRSATRELRRIPPAPYQDFFTSCFCNPCGQVQLSMELREETNRHKRRRTRIDVVRRIKEGRDRVDPSEHEYFPKFDDISLKCPALDVARTTRHIGEGLRLRHSEKRPPNRQTS